MFRHNVCWPLKWLNEEFLCSGLAEKTNVLNIVSHTRECLRSVCNVTKEDLALSQKKMKRCFHHKAVVRNFQPGEKVFVLIPIPGFALTMCFSGPSEVKQS